MSPCSEIATMVPSDYSSEDSTASFLRQDSSGRVTPTTEKSAKSNKIEKNRFNKTRRLPELKKYLQGASEARSSPCSDTTALFVHWSNDLEANDDLNTMGELMHDLDIPVDDEPLDESACHPEWDLINEIRFHINRYRDADKKSLIIFCYSGRGETVNGAFNLVNRSGDQMVPWSRIKEYLFGEHMCMENIDTLGILDCCYTEVATRSKSSRKAQIIAASGIETEGITERIDYRSFTQRLVQAARQFKAKGSFTTADLYRELRYNAAEHEVKKQDFDYKAYPMPVMEPPVGVEPIKIMFRKYVWSARSKSEEEIVVTLTLKADSRETKLLKDVVHDLPDDLDVGITNVLSTSN